MEDPSSVHLTSGAPVASETVVCNDHISIIPGLPNDLARLCLAFVPLCHHGRLRAVSKAWRSQLSYSLLLGIRRKWKKMESFLCIFRDDPSVTCGEIFDPRSRAWASVPHMPCSVSTYGLTNFHCIGVNSGLLIIGGSLFDARNFPMDRPLASSRVFKYEPSLRRWSRLSDMRVPRGSFACGIYNEDVIIIAGGGSRHEQFPAAGSKLSAVEKYDMKNNRWHFVESLRNVRAGCAGFMYEGEFWVIGGYGSPRTYPDGVPASEYYRDGEILDLKTGTWRYLQPMWKEGERERLGKVAVMHPEEDASETSIFMLDDSVIFRYDFPSNTWIREATIPHRIPSESSCKLLALDDELFILSFDQFQSCVVRGREGSLCFHVYHPKKKVWRHISTRPHQRQTLRYPWGGACTIKL